MAISASLAVPARDPRVLRHAVLRGARSSLAPLVSYTRFVLTIVLPLYVVNPSNSQRILRRPCASPQLSIAGAVIWRDVADPLTACKSSTPCRFRTTIHARHSCRTIVDAGGSVAIAYRLYFQVTCPPNAPPRLPRLPRGSIAASFSRICGAGLPFAPKASFPSAQMLCCLIFAMKSPRV